VRAVSCVPVVAAVLCGPAEVGEVLPVPGMCIVGVGGRALCGDTVIVFGQLPVGGPCSGCDIESS